MRKLRLNPPSVGAIIALTFLALPPLNAAGMPLSWQVGEWHTVENTGYLLPYLPARRMIAADSALDEFGNFVPGCYGVDPATGQLNREPAERNHAENGDLFCGWANRTYQAHLEAGR